MYWLAYHRMKPDVVGHLIYFVLELFFCVVWPYGYLNAASVSFCAGMKAIFETLGGAVDKCLHKPELHS